MKFFWNTKLLFVILSILFFCSHTLDMTNESNLSSLLETDKVVLATQKSRNELSSEQVYQSAPYPRTMSNMILAYTMIYPDDKTPRSKLDSIGYENGNIVIYRPNADGSSMKILIDIQELSWLCGKSLLCKPEEALEKMQNSSMFKKNDFKLYISNLYEKLGSDSTNCIADEYRFGIMQKAIIICFKNNLKEVEFKNLFSDIQPSEMESKSIQEFDKLAVLTHMIYFSDGRETLEEKNVTFKENGAYEEDNLVFNYGEIENINGKKCQIRYRLPIVPTNFLNIDIFDRNCVARFKYNKVDTYIGSNSQNCVNIMKYVITKIKLGCLKAKNGQANILKNELKSDPTHGKWQGMVYYHKIVQEDGGEISNLLHKLVISEGKFTILDKDSHEVKIVEFPKVKWICNNDGSCTLEEYKRYLFSNNKSTHYFISLYKEGK